MKLAAAALILLSLTASASAQDVEAAVTAYHEARFDDASRILDEVLQTPMEDPAELSRAHFLLARLAIIEGRREDAQAHFEIALAIDPQLTTPDDLPPDDAAEFQRVRESRRGEPIEIQVTPDGPVVGGETLNLRYEVQNSPAGLVTAVRARPGIDGTAIRSAGTQNSLTIPGHFWSSGSLGVAVEAVTDTGAVARRVQLTFEADEPGDDSAITASPWFWVAIGSGVAVVAAAVVIGVVVASGGTNEFGAPSGP